MATNAVLENKGAKTALITTKGFRDVLEFRRLRIPVMYDLHYQKPPELVRRRDRYELDERTNADGSIARCVKTEEVRDIGRRIIELGAEAIAISLINSYRNADNEADVVKALRGVLPEGTYLCASSEILPEIREYERTSTTVVNAYVGPLVTRYLKQLETQFAAAGIRPDILVMKSGGGTATVDEARRSPASIIESGPAAGVIAAASLARDLNLRSVISFDMGGTTAKAALIEDYVPAKTNEYEVGAGINISSKLVKGGGYPIRFSFIDVSEIGAGGGSIINVDPAARSIGVGPESAGASPGPACYGRGGDRATVTDALVVLGYINPEHLVGGALAIDRRKALDVIEEQVASPLGLSVQRAALGALEIATATMVRAVKAVTTYQGRDPREHSLVAFGGNGPVFAAQLADALGVSHVIVPENPGVFTAVGLLDASYELERVNSVYTPFAKFDGGQLAELADRLRRQILAESKRDGLSFRTTFEMKYMGQAYEIAVPVDDVAFDVAAIRTRFDNEHRRVYGHAEPKHPLDLVSIRMTGARIPKIAQARIPRTAARHGQRKHPTSVVQRVDRSDFHAHFD